MSCDQLPIGIVVLSRLWSIGILIQGKLVIVNWFLDKNAFSVARLTKPSDFYRYLILVVIAILKVNILADYVLNLVGVQPCVVCFRLSNYIGELLPARPLLQINRCILLTLRKVNVCFWWHRDASFVQEHPFVKEFSWVFLKHYLAASPAPRGVSCNHLYLVFAKKWFNQSLRRAVFHGGPFFCRICRN